MHDTSIPYPPLTSEDQVTVIPKSYSSDRMINIGEHKFKLKGDKTGQIYLYIGALMIEGGNAKDRIDLAISYARKIGADTLRFSYSYQSKLRFWELRFKAAVGMPPREEEEKGDYFLMARKLKKNSQQ
ncbi:hypothetical protein [Leptospira barantonii]|uniref:hypothetical protein n=1 Tax=Leptospira barantonii TaxID=2023184 RepID=UPI0014384BF0|nr:hypothetical protein [Leptospira barantonii]